VALRGQAMRLENYLMDVIQYHVYVVVWVTFDAWGKQYAPWSRAFNVVYTWIYTDWFKGVLDQMIYICIQH